MKTKILKIKVKDIGEIKETGITMIALVVTIVVLLILASITIGAVTSENGILRNANDAKEQTEIAEEKEIVDRATIQAMGNNKRGNIAEDELQEQLDKITGDGKTEADDVGEEFEVAFIESKRYYTVDKDGTVTGPQEIVEDKSPGDITKDENGDDLKGDEDEPYEIWCIEDLIEWSNNYEDYQYNNINLCTNLNFKSKHSYANSERTDYGDINEDNITDTLIQEMQKGKGFSPINSFSGVFNGNRFEIENIYIVNNGNVGLFRQINGAIICDFGISGYIESTQINNIQNGVGGIVGNTSANTRYEKSNIDNCWNKATIKGALDNTYTGVGGIVGQASYKTDIVNCYNKGKVIGEIADEIFYSNYAVGVGGILGYTRDGDADVNIYNSYNSGNISSNKLSYGIMGGIWAEGTCNIENCVNIGETQIGICRTADNISVNNIYYLDSASNTGGITNAIAVSENELCSEQFIKTLNDYINEETYKSNWKYWTLGEDGYPTFK